AAEGGVEVDEVDPLGARRLPRERRVERVPVRGLAAGLALDEPDGDAAGDVDGGQQLQVGRAGSGHRGRVVGGWVVGGWVAVMLSAWARIAGEPARVAVTSAARLAATPSSARPWKTRMRAPA